MKSQTTEQGEAIFYLTCHGIIMIAVMIFGYSMFTLTNLSILR